MWSCVSLFSLALSHWIRTELHSFRSSKVCFTLPNSFLLFLFLPAEMSHGSRNELGDGNNKHARTILKYVFINSFILLYLVVLRNTRNSYSLDEVHIFAVCERSSGCVSCVYHIKYMPSYRFFSSFVQINVFNVFISRESHSTRRRSILFAFSFYVSLFCLLSFSSHLSKRTCADAFAMKNTIKLLKNYEIQQALLSIPVNSIDLFCSGWAQMKQSKQFCNFSWEIVRTYEFWMLFTSTAKLFSQFSYFSFRVRFNCLFQFNRKFVYSYRFTERQTMWRRCRHAHKKWQNYRMRREKKTNYKLYKDFLLRYPNFFLNPNN